MHRGWAGWRISSGEDWGALLVLGSAFALGGLLGCLMASWIGGAGSDGLMDYIQSFLLAAQEEYAAAPAFLPLLWEQLRYPLAVVLLGFTALGLPVIPILFGMRAFFLSFAISAFIRMFGAGEGLVLSWILFGLSSMISIPVLFLLGTRGWRSSRTLAGGGSQRRRGEGRLHRLDPAQLGMCALCILACVLIEHYCTLQLLIWAADQLR